MSDRIETSAMPAGLAAMFGRGDLFSERCPSRVVLEHLTSRWGVLIMVSLARGTKRFSELRRGIRGINERMLALTLRRLEADGFVYRESLPVVPPHVEYSLTPLGREAAERIKGLFDWIETNLPRVMEAREKAETEEE